MSCKKRHPCRGAARISSAGSSFSCRRFADREISLSVRPPLRGHPARALAVPSIFPDYHAAIPVSVRHTLPAATCKGIASSMDASHFGQRHLTVCVSLALLLEVRNFLTGHRAYGPIRSQHLTRKGCTRACDATPRKEPPSLRCHE